MKNISQQKKGFSLVELMLAVAIIGILAGIVTVSLVGIRKRGDDTKILAELSATIQPMLTCWSDDGDIRFPSGAGGAIMCRDNSGVANEDYGRWPVMDSNYFYEGESVGNIYYDGSVNWSFYLMGNNGKICCNKKYKQCAIIGTSDTCDNTTNLTQY